MTVSNRKQEVRGMRFITMTLRAAASALAAAALAGGVASSEAHAKPPETVRATGTEIIGYDCTGRPITRFDTPPTWCPPGPPSELEA